MKNKTKEFIRSFNEQLELKYNYNFLEVFYNGYTEAVTTPRIFLTDDDNDGSEYIEQRALSRLTKTLRVILEIANKELSNRVDNFFAEKIKQSKEKFTNVNIKFSRKDSQYKVTTLGSYNEDVMEQFLETVKEDFEYIFDGLKLDVDL